MNDKLALQDRLQIREFSKDLHAFQRDMRILTAVKWPASVADRFLAQTGRPSKSSVRYSYRTRRDSFDLRGRLRSIDRLRRQAEDLFEDAVPDAFFIFSEILADFENIARLLAFVGTAQFGEVSARLWGFPGERIGTGSQTLLEIAEAFGRNLHRMSAEETEAMFPKILNAEGLASILRQRLQDAHLIETVNIRVTRKLIADAAAGKNYLKIRKHAKFSIKDVDVLLYHEVFTHIVTGLNGQRQPYAKWLGFETPRCSSTQEGLAVFLETLSGKTYPRRLRRILDRIHLLGKIEDGESPGHMYDWLREMRYSHHESLNLIMRAFRGCDPESRQPFTKDVSYLKGLVECYNFIQANLAAKKPDHIHALFVGKMNLREVPAIVRLIDRRAIRPAQWIPPQFLDLDSLAGWFSYVTALGGIRDLQLQTRYGSGAL